MIKFKSNHFYFCLEISFLSVVLNKQIEGNVAKSKLKLVRDIL